MILLGSSDKISDSLELLGSHILKCVFLNSYHGQPLIAECIFCSEIRMPRRSVSAAEKADEAPVERRVTRASTRKSVDGPAETASPEKQKAAEKEKLSAAEVKASPSGSVFIINDKPFVSD